jgi:hypothetical protein
MMIFDLGAFLGLIDIALTVYFVLIYSMQKRFLAAQAGYVK